MVGRMRVLDRKLLRDLWRIRGQAVAIGLVMGAGVAMFVMSVGTMRSLEATQGAYYERYRFADVFAQVKRAPEVLASRIAEIPGVKWAETRSVADVTIDVAGMDEPAVGRMVSLPTNRDPLLNAVALREGRRPVRGRPDEALASEAFAEAHGLGAGDHLYAIINGNRRRIEIVGIALSPEYVYSIAPAGLMPDDSRFGVLWMGREALAAAFDLNGAFNNVSLALLRSASTADVIDRLDAILEPYGAIGAYARDEQLSHRYLDNEMVQLRTVGLFTPVIFLAVAAFLLNIVISRLIATEREQIGVLKAFGYSDFVIGWHYLKLVLIVAAVGIALGFGAGTWLGRSLTELYTQFFRFPFLYYRAAPDIYALSGLVSLAAAAAGALGAVRQAVRLPPAVAMQPAAPPNYRKSAFEFLGLSRLMGQPTRMIVRHIARWPVRSALTVVGISLSAAIMIAALFSADAFDRMIDVTFSQSQRQDVTVAFVEPTPESVIAEIARLPGVLTAEPFRGVPVRLRLGHRERRLGLIGINPDADLSRLLDTDLEPLELPDTGIVLSTKLAELLGARRGDILTAEIREGRRPVRAIPVSAIAEGYIGVEAYMDLGALNRLMGEQPMVSGAHLLVDQAHAAELYRDLKASPAVAGITVQTAVLQTFRDTMQETLTIMTFFLSIFAGLIAFGVVYNSARIALSERGRELASLRVLGFTRGEVSYILLGEFGILTLVALPLGCGIGYGLAWLLARSLDTELFRIPLVVDRPTYGLAIVVVLISAALSALMARRRIDRLDLVAVLKTRE